MSDDTDIDDFDLDDDMDDDLDDTSSSDNDELEDEPVKGPDTKKGLMKRREIDDLIEQRRLERELRDSFDEDDDDDDDFDDDDD